MADRIGAMTQGLPGKIAERLNGAGSTRSTGATAPSRNAEGPAPAGGDRVELTPGGRLLERLEKTFAAMPEIDRGRVDAVKAAIARGEYEIDAERIAAALIRTDRQIG